MTGVRYNSCFLWMLLLNTDWPVGQKKILVRNGPRLFRNGSIFRMLIIQLVATKPVAKRGQFQCVSCLFVCVFVCFCLFCWCCLLFASCCFFVLFCLFVCVFVLFLSYTICVGQISLTTRKEGRKEMFYLTTHSTHFSYGYMASDIWYRTTHIRREEIRCRHIGYYFRLAARVLVYAPSHRQDDTYHDRCYTSRGALAGTRNSPMFPPWRIRSDDPSHHEWTLLPRSYISLRTY